ncbi:cytochrome P450 [Athelia psychrophila]|uniref:Cytochrome P450 n=1 Tax=Athelia psychrophila TaxID=1759441 RepID=A0A166B1I8_9AGAM|nr:cytochrome P450 [Fibularhizoctonia sp. CBS 109695]
MGLHSSAIESLLILLCSSALLFVARRYIDFRKAVHNVGDHPGYRVLFPDNGFWAIIPPRIPGVCLGENSAMINKHSVYEKCGSDVLTVISALPHSATQILVADADIIKEITSYRHRFPKPIEQYKVLTFFGGNIVASEGEEWKKFRKIAAPAFSDRNNKLVWDETVLIIEDLFENGWGSQEKISLDHAVNVTIQIALSVISVAGFGRRVPWKQDKFIPAGHQMTYQESLHIVSSRVFLKIIVPQWAMGLTKHTRNVELAFSEFKEYMVELIQERRTAEKRDERYDLFSSLLDANDGGKDGEAKLTTEELLGNMFIFQLAGHETTAHTLCFAFGLLALYQDEQEKLFQQIKSLMPDTRTPEYEEMPLFTYSMAVFYETLRLYPPVTSIPKRTYNDVIFNVGNIAGKQKQITVPAGAKIAIDTAGLHYNPRYWEDPHAFKPERFMDNWPRHAFLPFSAGARACLGRKFFETEGIAILTMMVSRYKIDIMDEPQFSGESFEQKRARVLKSHSGLTQTPVRVPLVFTRR